MTNNVHGHEILEMIHRAEPAMTRAGVAAEVGRRWGKEARFYTCSAEGMTLDELLAFLLERGKVVEQAGWLATDMSKLCGGR